MWYNIVRLVFSSAVVFLLIPLLRKIRRINTMNIFVKGGKTVARRRLPAIIAIAVLLLWQVFSFFPIENLFFEFPTATAAFRYNRVSQIWLVIEGEQSALVMYRSGNSEAQTVYPKSSPEGGYMLDLYPCFSNSKVATFEVCSAVVFKVNDCDDFYVRVVPHYGVEIQHITDNHGSTFQSVPDAPNVSYYTYVKDLEFDSYELIVDGVGYALKSIAFS